MSRPSTGPFAQFATNKAAETEGAWQDYGTFRLRLKRAYVGNTAFTRMKDALLDKPHGRRVALGTLPDEIGVPVLAKVYAQTIVVDWDSDLGAHTVEGPDGKPLKFSPEACEKVLAAVPDFLRVVMNDASMLATFQAAEAEEDAKN